VPKIAHHLDDAGQLQGSWKAQVRAYNGALKLLSRKTFAGQGGVPRVQKLGTFSLNAEMSASVPLLMVVDLAVSRRLLDRTFYW